MNRRQLLIRTSDSSSINVVIQPDKVKLTKIRVEAGIYSAFPEKSKHPNEESKDLWTKEALKEEGIPS